jgi:hypothetical protein
MKGKHCEILKVGNTTAIACGVPDRCEHDSNGEWYYLFVDKKTGKEVWISAGDADKHFPAKKTMRGASSSCSKCGALAINYCDMNLI